MDKNDTIPGIMKLKTKKRPSKARSVDNHYRSSGDEYELIARLAHKSDVSIADYTRKKLIPPNPHLVLDHLRSEQRKAGDLDDWFIHPKLKKAS